MGRDTAYWYRRGRGVLVGAADGCCLSEPAWPQGRHRHRRPLHRELLRDAIAFALRSVRLSSRRLGLTEDDRMRVADDTLRDLRRHGEWRELDDVVNGGPTAAQSARLENN